MHLVTHPTLCFITKLWKTTGNLRNLAVVSSQSHTTSLNTLSTEDKVAIRSLLHIINLCLFTKWMPNINPTTSYGWVVSDLKDLSEDLNRIALETSENITEVEATLCHYHLNKVLKSLLLTTRIARRRWPYLSPQTPSPTTCPLPTVTSTASPSPQTSGVLY